MAVRVAINGFGRIGRLAFRQMFGAEGIVSTAQIASLESKFASYKEEMEMSLVTLIGDEVISGESQVTSLNNAVKRYIPSLEDKDVGQFGIIAGKLYYIGDNELAIKAAKNQKIEVIPEETTLEDYISDVEKMAMENLVLNYGGEAFKNDDNNPLGVQLVNKELGVNWRIITEVENNSVQATCF